ncbi:phosphate signaling complex protein PhoU [Lacticaseibacillus sp. N501-2]|uniref:phosphate signaling complex protein PhoU n=1 Tax=Lacticaseibacillus salsurae TaxID=3367729 RepID=UPI0038B341D1
MPEMLNRDLHRLNHLFEDMGLNVSEQIELATKAFLKSNRDAAQKVIDRDGVINDDELHLEKLIIQTLALQQPVASDFRVVMSILKSSTDLERIGDHAVGIARETQAASTQRIATIDAVLTHMSTTVRNMLEQILTAYVHTDVALAKLVAASDLDVDRDFVAVRKHTTQLEDGDADLIASYLFVSRLLERIGDHVVNIAEWIVYNHTGKIVELNLGKQDRRRAEGSNGHLVD